MYDVTFGYFDRHDPDGRPGLTVSRPDTVVLMFDPDQSLANQVAALAQSSALRVGVAESLTGGRLAAALSAAPDASEWFCGGLVAYQPHTKFALLDVTPGPVNTGSCAIEMATGALRIFDADVTVAVTGVGGPGPDEGVVPGTVFIATATGGGAAVSDELHLSGDPERVLSCTITAALRQLVQCLSDSDRSPKRRSRS